MNEIEEVQLYEEAIYWVFRVGEKDFLLPIELVKEVVDISAVFPVPLAPEYIYGVIPLRGKIIPTIDLSKIFQTGNPNYENARLIVVDAEIEMAREIINEGIGFLSENLPYLLKCSTDITSDDFIQIKNFFQEFRIKDMTHGRV